MTPDQDARERLVRIEARQERQQEVLERLVELLDRVLAVELGVNAMKESLKRAGERLEIVEKELTRWRTVHAVVSWLVGIATAVITAYVIHRLVP